MASFTIDYTIGDTKFLWVAISTPYNDGTGRIWRGNGILDTGSSSSAISERLAKELKLTSMGLKTYHGVSGEDCGDVYNTTLKICETIPVTSIQLGTFHDPEEDFDFLIGLDIIKCCDLCLHSHDGIITLRMEWPPE